MKKLKLPRFKTSLPDKPKNLSMDEYLRFVEFNREQVMTTKNRCQNRHIRPLPVNVLFVLKRTGTIFEN
jgi:hypothetical protein